MTAKTPAERQQARRDRLAAAQTPEVRGIYANVDDHQAIKAYAAKLAGKRAGVKVPRGRRPNPKKEQK